MTDTLRHLFHPANASAYAASMAEAVAHLTETLERVERPSTGASPEAARARVAAVDLDAPLGSAPEAIREMERLWLDDAVWFHEPGYAAHLNCPVVIPALTADLYASAVNSSLDTFDQSVGATFIERALIDWTAGRMGLGDDADGIFTSGGTQSNLQALFLAKERARHRGVAPERMRILASRDGHFSVQKAARIMGLGDESVVAIDVDENRRMSVAALRAALGDCFDDGRVPMAVVATAGTTDFGAIDPLDEIADLCRLCGSWLHVDAAYGGGLIASRAHADRLAGIGRADSVTIDFHKNFFQPVASSALLVRNRATLTAVSWHADYLNPEDSTDPNQVDKSMQTTRRFDALKLWLTLRIMGADAIGEMTDAVIALAERVHDRLRGSDDIELAAAPQLSTLVLRYAPASLDEDRLARLNAGIRERLHRGGEAMVAATRVDGRQFLKFTLLNPLATEDDILAIVDRIRTEGASELAAAPELAMTGADA